VDTLGAIGEQLVFIALSLGLMQLSLSRRRGGGLFSALPLGLLPALALAGALFAVMQQPDSADMAVQRTEWAAFSKKMAQQLLPDKEQADDRTVVEQTYAQSFEAQPAGLLCLFMAVLAPLAAWLRRRQYRHGQAPDPGPLAAWSVPWGMVWLVLAPVFWMAASRQGLVAGPDWADHLALNVVTVGSVIFLFQGLVVAGAKVAVWARDPRTRALAGLGAAVLLVGLLFADHFGILQLLLLLLMVTGLLEPWADLRRLNPPKAGEKQKGA